MSDTDYGSDNNEIFEDHSLELDGQILAIVDRQTPAINELDIHSSGELSNETDYGNGNNKFLQDNTPVNSISHHDQGNRNFLTYQLNNTSSMADFDILQSSSPSLLNNRNHSFLISTVNLEPASTK